MTKKPTPHQRAIAKGRAARRKGKAAGQVMGREYAIDPAKYTRRSELHKGMP